jgi:hypothetical protein
MGLVGNPFAGEVPGPFVDRGLPEPAPRPGARAGTLVQVIGAAGAGKSTHLQHWRRSRPGPYHHVDQAPYRHRWRRPPVEEVVYGDEIDRMPRPLRRRWFAALARINALAVVGTHVDLRPVAARAGLAVVTHRLEPPDLATLSLILRRRLDAAAVGVVSPEIAFLAEDLAAVHRRAGGSIRRAEEECHRLLAERVDRCRPPRELP